MTIEILDEPVVTVRRVSGDDNGIVEAARVSVLGENEVSPEELPTKTEGLINYLVKNRHGSPFEHNSMTFYVKAPIFVFREFQRHRVGFSYNEMSGRYTELPAEFYIPSTTRPLVNIGSSAKPKMAPGTDEQYEIMVDSHMTVYTVAWDEYKRQIDYGIAKEVARDVLPLGIMSQMYVTMNARSAMSFLSLRVEDDTATFLSRPQFEIQQVAKKIEEVFASRFPLSYQAFIKNGRVSP